MNPRASSFVRKILTRKNISTPDQKLQKKKKKGWAQTKKLEIRLVKNNR